MEHTTGDHRNIYFQVISSVLEDGVVFIQVIILFSFLLLGKGEHGKPYPLTEEDHDDSAYRENGFNIFVSNNIALERSLPDIRHAK